MCSLANFYTETVTLNISTSMVLTRIECRAFLLEISEVPCCNNSNHNSLCQPDTGIARVVVDIVGPSYPTVSTLCKPGVSLPPLKDECPLNGQPKYCHLDGVNVTQTRHIERGDLKMFYMIVLDDWLKVSTMLNESEFTQMKSPNTKSNLYEYVIYYNIYIHSNFKLRIKNINCITNSKFKYI